MAIKTECVCALYMLGTAALEKALQTTVIMTFTTYLFISQYFHFSVGHRSDIK